MSRGLMIRNGELNSTMPRALRGALSRSVIAAFRGSPGLTSMNAVPFSRSYVPIVPNSTPPANGKRSVTIRRVIGASESATKHVAAIATIQDPAIAPLREANPRYLLARDVFGFRASIPLPRRDHVLAQRSVTRALKFDPGRARSEIAKANRARRCCIA